MSSTQLRQPASVRQNYLLRITTYAVIFLLYCSLFDFADKSWGFWLAIFANGLLYPHLAYRLVKTNVQEHRLLLWDAMSYGVHLGLWGFNPFLISIFSAAICVTYLAVGGTALFLRAGLAFMVGLGVGGVIGEGYFREHLPWSSLLIVSVGFILYMANLGYLIFAINSKLRKTRKNMAIQQEDLVVMSRLAQAVNSNLNIDTILNAIMEALQKRYNFESLYILPFSEDKSAFVISGIYGATISEVEKALFLKMEFNLQQHKDSMFVHSLVSNKMVYIPRLTPEMLIRGGAVDRELYAIKPSVSIAYFPVSVNQQVIAGAAFINYVAPFDLEPDDLERINHYLIHAGSALRNVHMFNELNAAKESAEHAKRRAEQSEEAKSRFLANMSHEIRTPLTAVLGYAEALQEKNLPEAEREKFVNIIARSGQHLLSMINDILDIAKIEAGKINLESVPVYLVPLLRQLHSLTELRAKEKNLQFTLNITYPVPSAVQGDITRLNQIMLNLLNNALKFTLAGGITLEAGYTEGQLMLAVEDTGIGIDTDKNLALFAAFTQADSSTTRLFGGTGLGLFISQNLAQLMGGHIHVSSTLGHGSRFELRIPVTLAGSLIEDDQAFDQAWQAEAEQEVHLPKLIGRLLVAEDNLENQQLISRILQQLGLQFDLVNNGAQALVLATQHHYDLLLLDLQMPLMGGKEAAEILLRRGCKAPILAFTANLMSHQKAEYEAVGFAGIVEKPFNKMRIAQQLALYLPKFNKVKKLLLVDDDRVNQMVVMHLLKKIQPELVITQVFDGGEAVELASHENFDLILMDRQMPLLDGLAATQQLRLRNINTPIYILSAQQTQDLAADALAAGANGCLEKPLKKADFIALLQA